MGSIAENVARVRERIESAAGGRRVLLVAASKMNDADRVREAVAAGVDACGENRVQELVEKRAAGAYEGAGLHFIGHLQRNKVKYLVGSVGLIESVDSVELLGDISARAQRRVSAAYASSGVLVRRGGRSPRTGLFFTSAGCISCGVCR